MRVVEVDSMLDPPWLSRIDDPPSRQKTLERGGPMVARQRTMNLTEGRPERCRDRQVRPGPSSG